MIIRGIRSSWEHDQNGMTYQDMADTKVVANKLGVVIVFRSTGPWAKRWLERGYPSKNFHVKGKSSDWGPQAGFVPFDGFFSKVGYDKEKAMKGTAANIDGLESGFAAKAPLVLTAEELKMQLTEQSGGRTAIKRKTTIAKSHDLLLFANISGTDRECAFRAVKLLDGRYEIRAFPPQMDIDPLDLPKMAGYLLEVMTSNEVGANNMPMTGDYDLLLVSPPMSQYGSLTPYPIRKPGIRLNGRPPLPDFVFAAGVGMDNVIDPSLHTAGNIKTNYQAVRNAGYFTRRKRELGNQAGPVFSPKLPEPVPLADIHPLADDDGTATYNDPVSLGRREHHDMGNITPRILQTINELNRQMGAIGEKAAFRRVHHNAEAYRNAQFGALTKKDMLTKKDGEAYGDGFPLTLFQPNTLCDDSKATSIYTDVCTLENYSELQGYIATLTQAGFYVPRNWAWQTDNTPQASESVKAVFSTTRPRQ